MSIKGCSIEGCEKKSMARGWCPMHYRRWLWHGDTEVKLSPWQEHITYQRKCKYLGCETIVKNRLYCRSHYSREYVEDSAGSERRFKRSIFYNDELFNTWTKESAYALGWVASDGNVMEKGSQKVTIASKDREAMDILLRIFNYPNEPGRSKSDCWRLQLHSAKMVRKLISMGIVPNKSLVLKMPEIPQSLLSHFIRGEFDGDGSIRAPHLPIVMTLDSASEEYINGLKQAIPFNASLSVSHRGDNAPYYRLVWCGQNARDFGTWMYQDSDGLRLSRKYDRFVSSSTRVTGRGHKKKEVLSKECDTTE